MSAGTIGLIAGLAVGLINLVALRMLARRVEMAETRRVLSIVGVLDLALFPVLGYLVGTYMFA